MKRVISVQDISCFGKCSLTVALPVISAMGVECAIIPTAVLSTHTGGFTGFTFRDLSTDIPSILDHWKSINLTADALYSGYLGSIDQVDVMTDFFDNFRSDNTIVLVDPVMGDAGKLYTGFDKAFAKKMAELCRHADVIVPNLTEACFLLDIPYREDMSLDEQKDILRRLSAFGSRHAVLTGVKPEQGKQGALAYDAKEDVFTSYYAEDIPMNCHGTGDIFSSVLCGALTQGKTMQEALRVAVEFTVSAIRETLPHIEEHYYGVMFEPCLANLATLLKD